MTIPPEPNEQIEGDRAKRLSARDLALLLPNLGKLLWRLARDKRVPLPIKALVIGTGVYLALPFDVIPDWLPGVGYLDDALLVGFVLHRLIRHVSPEILAEHWDGAVPLPELARRLSLRARVKGDNPPRQERTP